jgi:indole-3-acetate monooxygenase
MVSRAAVGCTERSGYRGEIHPLYYDTMERAWERTLAGVPHTVEHKADLQLAAAHATATASTVADRMHRYYGHLRPESTRAPFPLERHFRDAQTLRHHGFLSESRFEAVGQVYSGVEREFGLIGF